MLEQILFTEKDAREIGEKLGIDWDIIEFDEFIAGLLVELEHGSHDPETNVTDNDLEKTAKIALAHLKEFGDYYTRLEKMEEEAKIYWKQ